MRIVLNAEQSTMGMQIGGKWVKSLYVQVQVYHGRQDELMTWGTCMFESENDYNQLRLLLDKLNDEIATKEKEYVPSQPA